MEKEQKITILHLSDLQSGNMHSWWAPRPGPNTPPTYNGTFHSQIATELKKAMRSDPSFAVDLILVTGDIAERAEINEYGPALEFLTLLRKELSNSFSVSPKICVIPGNHDVDRPASAGSSNRSSQEQFDAKFANFKRFLKQVDPEFNESGDKFTFQTPFIYKKVVYGADKGEDTFRLDLFGLNSCMQESNKDEDHFGYIGNHQLHELRKSLSKIGTTPYSIRVAAFHHNPLLQGQATAEAIEDLFQAKLHDKGRKLAMDLRNYLHDSRALLANLAEQGFHVALHGHQHINEIFTVGLPWRYGEPLARSTIVTLGAGSAGLRHGTNPQPSIASALLLSFTPITWGWRLETQRITFAVHGEIRPYVSVELGNSDTLILPRGQPLEAVSAVARALDHTKDKALLVAPADDELTIDPTKKEDLDRFVGQFQIWKSAPNRKMDAKLDNIDSVQCGKPREVRNENLYSDMSKSVSDADFRLLLLLGLRKWSTGNFRYGDTITFALRDMEIDGNNPPKIGLCAERYAETDIYNRCLRAKILDMPDNLTSFRTKYIIEAIDEYKKDQSDSNHGLIKSLQERFPFLSWRCEATVLATIRTAKKPKDLHLLVRRATEYSVDIESSAASLFASGGCRPSQEKDYSNGQAASNSVYELQDAVNRMLKRETEYEVRDWPKEMRLIALYLDPLNITPVWLYWLDLTVDSATLAKAGIESPNSHDEWISKCQKIQLQNKSWKNLHQDILNETDTKKVNADPLLGLYIWFNWMNETYPDWNTTDT